MADKKISALPDATTPLAGTEVLPIVQSNTTVKVSVANLSAGRDISAKQVSATDNVVISTAGKGIDFSANANAAGMTSELLNWYEVGTWTPTLITSGTQFTSITYSAATAGRYTRIGNTVYVQLFFRTDAITVGSASGNLRIGGLPFTAIADPAGQSCLVVGRSQDWVTNNPSGATVAASNTYVDLFYRATSDGNSLVLPYTAADTAAAKNRLQLSGWYNCA